MNFAGVLRKQIFIYKILIPKRFTSRSTIFSLSSGYGKCGVSVVRVSGPNSLNALRALTSTDFNPKPRYAVLKSLRHPASRDVIDRGLVLWFPGPRSFTGEDSCEFQVHGSIAVVAALLDALGSVPGLRMAQAGEFTKRAFFNGKIDLTEVEGLADLIRAETEAQRKQALLQSNGALSKLYRAWRQRIIKSIAHLEAYIDFAEDENIEDNVMTTVNVELNRIENEIRHHLNDHRQGEILRDGVRTVIIGAPNVGKSSFLNLICQKQVSIVTPIAGTTRDIIESPFNIGGYPVLFADTAGLRKHTKDTVESEGISRALDYMQQSDLVILLVDAVDLVKAFELDNSVNSLSSYMKNYLQRLGINLDDLREKKVVSVANKIDLLNDNEKCILANFKTVEKNCTIVSETMKKKKELEDDEEEEVVAIAAMSVAPKPISCKTNTNIESLLASLTEAVAEICGQPSAESPKLSQSRYRHHLKECVEHLENFRFICSSQPEPDLAIAAQKLRQAVRCIGRITGDVSSEEILDVIFHDFCIGK